jgi:hypothetical protein
MIFEESKSSNMKKIIILEGFIAALLISCGTPNEPVQAISKAEKIEIIKFESATKVLEAKREEIEISTKELQELLKEL